MFLHIHFADQKIKHSLLQVIMEYQGKGKGRGGGGE